jgi:hypothetical protein
MTTSQFLKSGVFSSIMLPIRLGLKSSTLSCNLIKAQTRKPAAKPTNAFWSAIIAAAVTVITKNLSFLSRSVNPLQDDIVEDGAVVADGVMEALGAWVIKSLADIFRFSATETSSIPAANT